MPQLDLDRYIPFFLSSVGNKLSRGASRTYLERFGVGVNEWRLLANLKVRGRASAGEICQASGIDKAAASRAVTRLDQLGCIVSTDDPDDGRSRTLALTEAGHSLHDRIISVALEREAALLDGLDASDRETLIRLLQTLYRNVAAMERRDG